jgi:hypothetical protein
LTELKATSWLGLEQAMERSLVATKNTMTLDTQLYYKKQTKYFALLIAEHDQDIVERLE